MNLLIKAASKIVKYFKKSASAASALEAAQIKLKVEQHRLIQSCETRWNSIYEMFQHLESQKQCVQAVLADRNIVTLTKEEDLSLSVVQWNRITTLLPVLYALQIATTAMPLEQNTSVSCILPVITGLLKIFLDEKIQDSLLLQEFKRKVSQALKERFFLDLKGDSVASVSSALDPRHKNLKFLSSEMQFSVQEHVRFLVNLVTTDKEPVVEKEPATKKSAMVLLLGSDYYDDQQLLRDQYSYFRRGSRLPLTEGSHFPYPYVIFPIPFPMPTPPNNKTISIPVLDSPYVKTYLSSLAFKEKHASDH